MYVRCWCVYLYILEINARHSQELCQVLFVYEILAIALAAAQALVLALIMVDIITLP